MTATVYPEADLWTIKGKTYRAYCAEMEDGTEGILLIEGDDPQWEEVYTICERVVPDLRVEGR